MRKAKFRYRFLSTLFDIIAIAVIAVGILVLNDNAIIWLQMAKEGFFQLDLVDYIQMITAFFLIEIFLTIYLAVIPSYTKGQTLGMYMFKVKVIYDDGRAIDFSGLFIRQVLVNLLLPLFTFGISYLVSIFISLYRKDHFSLADIISKSHIVDKLDY